MSLSRYLKPPPLCSTRITGRHSSYGWLRLPSTTARVLALTLVHGCPLPTDRCSDLPGYRVFSMSGSTRPRTPGSIRAARQGTTRTVACRGAKPVGTLQPKFSGLNAFRVGITRYLCTSPAFAPTHRRACYQSRRKARYWARGSRLPRRDFHPLEHAALPGRTRPFSLFPIHNTVDLVYFWCESLMGAYPASRNRRKPEHLSCLHLGNRAIGLWPGKWQ